MSRSLFDIYIPRLTGFGANNTLVGLQSSSSWPGRTDRHSDMSIWEASVQTQCDSNNVVRSFQLFSGEKKTKFDELFDLFFFVSHGV